MPGKALVVDANILVRAVLGKRVREVIEQYAARASFFVPDVAYAEAEEHLPALVIKLGGDPAKALAFLRSLAGLVDLIGSNCDLDLDLRKETHRVFSPTIDFRVTLLPAVSLDLRHCQTVNADGGQRVTNFFQLEWLNDRHNDFHGS